MEPVICVNGLVQSYGRRLVFSGLSFEVAAGECFGVFGTGGSGKTSLLHILAGIDRFKSGAVTVLGCDISRSEAFKKRMGLVTQVRSQFMDLTVSENLDFFAVLKDAPLENIEMVCSRLELNDYLKVRADELEDGVFQRLSLASALINSPDLLIADDLFKDIDLESRRILLKEVTRFLSTGGTCVWGFSDIDCCSIQSRVGWLENGSMSIMQTDQAAEEWERRVQLMNASCGA